MIDQFFRESNRSVRRRLGLVVFAGLAVVIAYATLTTPQSDLSGLAISDKVLHFGAFAMLVLPVAFLNKRALIWAIPASLAFGGAIEVIQPYVGRQAEWLDFVADASGVAFGAAFGLVIRSIAIRVWRRRPD